MAGYGYVTDKGFASFARELSEGAWKEVSIEAHDGEGERPLAGASLLAAPLPVVWKLRATWAIRALASAMGTAADLLELDVEWDSSQRALNLALLAAAEHREAETRAAAERLRAALLMGGGAAQTQLSYEQEVAFGYAQLEHAGTPPLAADVRAVELWGYLERVKEATDALAIGLGHGAPLLRADPRAQRIRAALTACATAFAAIHEQLGWVLEHTAAGAERQRLAALEAPFSALLERYPPRAKTSAEAVEETAGGGSG